MLREAIPCLPCLLGKQMARGVHGDVCAKPSGTNSAGRMVVTSRPRRPRGPGVWRLVVLLCRIVDCVHKLRLTAKRNHGITDDTDLLCWSCPGRISWPRSMLKRCVGCIHLLARIQIAPRSNPFTSAQRHTRKAYLSRWAQCPEWRLHRQRNPPEVALASTKETRSTLRRVT